GRAVVSFVIPAHNEVACLLGVLDALIAAADQVGTEYEILIVNDVSPDRTGQAASRRGVRVLDVRHCHIAATWDAGAREASGDILFFVDADTTANAAAIAAGLTAIEQGAVGGG